MKNRKKPFEPDGTGTGKRHFTRTDRSGTYPDDFNALWVKRQATSYNTSKAAAYALYLVMKREYKELIEHLTSELIKERLVVDSYSDNTFSGDMARQRQGERIEHKSKV